VIFISIYKESKIKLRGKYFDFFDTAESVEDGKKKITKEKKRCEKLKTGKFEFVMTIEYDLLGNKTYVIWRRVLN